MVVGEEGEPTRHFLIVCYPLQSHINPALQLARNIASAGARATFSTVVSAHRRMFPDSPDFPRADAQLPLLSYHPFSDGYDDGEGFDTRTHDTAEYLTNLRSTGPEALRPVATAPRSPPVTHLIHAFLMPWVAGVARWLNIPSSLFWTQAASVFATLHHYFHGYGDYIDSHARDPNFVVELPNVPRLRVRDLPSFLVDATKNGFVLPLLRKEFETLEDAAVGCGALPPRVLVNSFQELEGDVLGAAWPVELVPVGPILPVSTSDVRRTAGGDLSKWLGRWDEGSAVYVAFGSYAVLGQRQRGELTSGLVESGRPFLWVDKGGVEALDWVGKGKVVDWCNQLEVLSHKAIGCFVTHNGWNSTIESMTYGVPMVSIPQWIDQSTNARLVESEWGVGVCARVDEEDGVVVGSEIRRCLDEVMGQGATAKKIREKVMIWKEKAWKAAIGGSSEQNLKAFIVGDKLPS